MPCHKKNLKQNRFTKAIVLKSAAYVHIKIGTIQKVFLVEKAIYKII